MDDITIDSASGLLAYFQFNENYPSYALQEAFMMIHDMLEEDASDPMFGHIYDNSLDEDEVKVTIVATGIGGHEAQKQEDIPATKTAVGNSAKAEAPKVSINVSKPTIKTSSPKIAQAQQTKPQSQAKPQNINYRTPIPKQPDEDEEDYPAYWKRNSRV